MRTASTPASCFSAFANPCSIPAVYRTRCLVMTRSSVASSSTRSPWPVNRSANMRRMSSSGDGRPERFSTGNTATSCALSCGRLAGSVVSLAATQPEREESAHTSNSLDRLTLLEELHDEIVDGVSRHVVHRPASASEEAVPDIDAPSCRGRRPDDLARLRLQHLDAD